MSEADEVAVVFRAIASRRSVRQFERKAVPEEIVQRLVELACAAPAPHHTRPWRFVNVASSEARSRLSESMAASWRADLEFEEPASAVEDEMIERSRREIADAPVLLLSCLVLEGMRRWPDDERRRAERDMFVQSLGAGLQNILVAAHAQGVAGYLKGAPLFCPKAVISALDLPTGWHPAFFVLLGYAAENARVRPRPAPDLEEMLLRR